MSKILFISHDASRTGAPIVLLNLLKWFKSNTTCSFDILLLGGGPLETDFELLGNVYRSYSKGKRTILEKMFYKIVRKIKLTSNERDIEILKSKLKKNQYSTIYGNTIVSIKIFEFLSYVYPKAKFILHVHEMYSYTKEYDLYIKKTEYLNIKYIAVSKMVESNLIDNHGIRSKIEIIYEFIDVLFVNKTRANRPNADLKNFVINGSGVVQVRKGYDVFILIAKRAIQKYPEIPFLFKWIGYIPEDLRIFIEMDIRNGGLEGKVEFVGAFNEPYPEYSKADVFLLTSREDPFPLVCLEHAVMGMPILCFNNATGIAEFVESGAGVIIPYFDIEFAVNEIYNLYINTEKRKEISLIARTQVQQYDISIQCPKILNIILNE